jgi:hypothetical protein
LKKFFVLPGLPSNEKNSFDHHNSYNEGPNLAFFSFTKSPSNSLLTIKFPKNHITSSYHSNMPKTARAKIWLLRILGINTIVRKLLQSDKITFLWYDCCQFMIWHSSRASQQTLIYSEKNIHNSCPRWILSKNKLKFGGKSLLSPTLNSTIWLEQTNFESLVPFLLMWAKHPCPMLPPWMHGPLPLAHTWPSFFCSEYRT